MLRKVYGVVIPVLEVEPELISGAILSDMDSPVGVSRLPVVICNISPDSLIFHNDSPVHVIIGTTATVLLVVN